MSINLNSDVPFEPGLKIILNSLPKLTITCHVKRHDRQISSILPTFKLNYAIVL